MCNRVRRESWNNKNPAKSGREINMAAGSEGIAESLSKCVKNLATAAEALQTLRGKTGSQKSKRLKDRLHDRKIWVRTRQKSGTDP